MFKCTIPLQCIARFNNLIRPSIYILPFTWAIAIFGAHYKIVATLQHSSCFLYPPLIVVPLNDIAAI